MAAAHSLNRNNLLPCVVYLLASCLVVACYAKVQRTKHGFDIGSLEAAIGKLTMQHGQRRLHANIPPVCLLKQEVGICRASLTRYHYDATSTTCKEFVYGGCGGNDNNFGTQEECMATCATGPQGNVISTPTTDPEQGGTPPATITNPGQPSQPSNPEPIAMPPQQVPAPGPAPSSGHQTCPELFTYTALFACMAMLFRLL